MTDIASLLLAQRQGEQQRKQALAQNLLKTGQQVTNPLLAGLAGFLGANELQAAAQPVQTDDIMQMLQAEEERRRDLQEREFALKERGVDLEAQKIEQDREKFEKELALKQKKAQNALNLTKGEEKVDERFAEEFVEFNAKGGFADVQKNIDQLKRVQQSLKKGEVSTGLEQYFTPDFLNPVIFPDSTAAQEQVEEVVQRNLRLVLGAQFTEKEGERLIKRAYNPDLDEEENSRRLGNLVTAIEMAALSKQSASEYFRQNGTLKGWEGRQFSLADIEEMIDAKQSFPKTDSASGFKFLGYEE